MGSSMSSEINKDIKIKAGFIQFNPVLGFPEKNIKVLSRLLNKAKGAELIVIPELANSGYNFKTRKQAFDLAEPVPDGEYVRFLVYQAKKFNLHIVSGVNEKDGDKLYNSAVLVGPGGFIGKYRKMHLFMNEFDFFEKGDSGFPVYEINDFKIGILICFDWIFPEAWRIIALQGADVICHPSNLVLPYAQQAVPVHGMINRVFCITANRYGTERDITFSGQSIISDPAGNTLYTASAARDECVTMQIDIVPARNKMITQRNHVFNDRRPEQYNDLTIS